jgi:hypothetical protein
MLGTVSGQPFEQEIQNVSSKLGRSLAAKGYKKVAVSDFTDLEGRPTELGRFIAEQLSVELVNAPGISVMDRAHLKSILAEHKLSAEGLVNPETAKKLGQFAGVDALIIGTITPLDESMVVTIKAISTETAEIAAAASVTIQKTKELHQFSQNGVSRSVTDSAAPPRPEVIAMKDYGDLRVELTSIQPATVYPNKGSVNALLCVLTFTNRNLREQILVATNGEPADPSFVRARITDSAGNTLQASQVSGLSGVSVYGLRGQADTSAIADTIMHGEQTSGRAYYSGEKLWMGNLTQIPPGESVQATMTFTAGSSNGRENRRVSLADDAQFVLEFVATTGSKSSRGCRFYNLLWSGVRLPSGVSLETTYRRF